MSENERDADDGKGNAVSLDTNKATWIYGLWFVASADNTSDWLGKLVKVDNRWVFEYRFRYYNGPDPWDGKDSKSWFAFASDDDSVKHRDAILAAMKELLSILEIRYSTKHEFVFLDCAPDDPKVFFELGSRPWCHVKRIASADTNTEGEK